MQLQKFWSWKTRKLLHSFLFSALLWTTETKLKYFIWILMKMWKRIFTFSLFLQQDFIQIKYNYISIHNWWFCRSIFLFRFQVKRHPHNKCFSSHFIPLFLVIFKKDNVILSYSKLLVFSTFHYAFNRNLLAFYQIDLPLSVSPLKALLLRKKEIIL